MDTFEDLNDLLTGFGLVPASVSTEDDAALAGAITDIDLDEDPDDLMVPEELVEEFIDSLASAADEDRDVEPPTVVPQPILTPAGDSCQNMFDPESDPQNDIEVIKETVRQGCGCTLECFKTITSDRILDNILSVREMAKETKEAHIISRIVPIESTKRCTEDTRTRNRFTLYFRNTKVCQAAFQVIYDIKRGTLKRLQSHVSQHGIQPRTHGLSSRRSNNAYPPAVIKDAVQYLINYASEEGLPQPAPVRGRQGLVPVYLPVSNSKMGIHEEYVECCKAQEKAYVGRTTFKGLWARCVPHIKIMGPKEDVCSQCEQLIEKINLARNNEENKLQLTSMYHAHVLAARTEREEYVRCVAESTTLFDLQTADFNKVHFTFDFSQYMKLPHHAREKGPTFFIQPRKVQLFGFRIDGHRQYNYLIDEDQSIGLDGQHAHGPDAVISMVDHALTEFRVPGEECRIHADNCFAQNKNRFVLAYFSWRTMTRKHQRITYMMQLPGHTRCLIDAGFGRIKQKYRHENADVIDHLASIVDRSSSTNVPVMYGMWQWRAWKEFLGLRFKKVPNINSYYYFRFEATDPGAVYMRQSATDVNEKRFVICKTHLLPMADDIPEVIPAAGLSDERKRYLYKHVRPLVRVPFRDSYGTCPTD